MIDKDFLEFPKELDKKCAKEEFHKMMSFDDTEIPIEKVNFLEYPDDDIDNLDYDIRELVVDEPINKQEKTADNKKVFTPEQYELMMTADGYYFHALKDEISKGHDGQRVVIQNCRVIGYFNSIMEAIGFMSRNGQRGGTYSIHDCGECENEMRILTPSNEGWEESEIEDEERILIN